MTKLYDVISKEKIKYLFKNFLFIKKKINLIYMNLLDIFIINKYYKCKKYPTNILIFNNYNIIENSTDFYLCNILIESESKFFYKKLFFFYTYIIIHGIIHAQNFIHKKYFFKKNIFNYLEIKFLKILGFNENFKYINFSKYNKYFN